MKRIRDFTLVIPMPEVVLRRRVTGFHTAWETAVEVLKSGVQEICMYDATIDESRMMAVFSTKNFIAEPDASQKYPGIRWRVEPIPQALPDGSSGFANLNRLDFAWCWLDGAELDVPFRLNFLERKAERNPSGPAAFSLGLIKEVRDLLRR